MFYSDYFGENFESLPSKSDDRGSARWLALRLRYCRYCRHHATVDRCVSPNANYAWPHGIHWTCGDSDRRDGFGSAGSKDRRARSTAYYGYSVYDLGNRMRLRVE